MNNALKTAIALLFFFSIQVFASGEITNWEQYYLERKQKNYEESLASLPAPLLSKSEEKNDHLVNPFLSRVTVENRLKEQLINPQLRGKGGDFIYQESPQIYSDLYKKLVEVMHDLPMNSYTGFTFQKIIMAIEVGLTKEGLDYLQPRAIIGDTDEIPEIQYLK